MKIETWDLTPLYSSFESNAFQQDFLLLKQKIKEITVWCNQNLTDTSQTKEKLEFYLSSQNTLGDLFSRLYDFTLLTSSTDTENETANQYTDLLEENITELTAPDTFFQKWVCTLPEEEFSFSSSPLIQEHQFYLNQIRLQGKYLLSDAEEVILAKMKTTGSSAWGRLQEQLTSTLSITLSLQGKKQTLPLSAVRNLAYSSDPKTRQTAFQAELDSYPSIAPSVAACLNGIKGEVNLVSDMRGFSSPLEMTLVHSRMDQETLDAMFSAIKESLPFFESYFQKKASLLGHQNGLPFYDLFAPIGNLTTEYTYQEAQSFILEHFSSFSQKLGDYAEKAFQHHWIDVYPKEGKRGGAFCSNLHSIGESRILTNFSGTFNDVITLAHELGHGYHGDCLAGQSYLNSDYPMPIAETASTFCETLVKNAALKKASPQEAQAILEADICDNAQVIVDILSRFLFESAVFERRRQGSLSVRELCNLMTEAQKQAYGKGLNTDTLHPYMWLCKSHYYDADYNYYNFPYAFGLLFAKGLYAHYQKLGKSFVPLYDQLLASTGSASLLEVAQLAKIQLHDKEFWKNSLSIIQKDIALFLSL